MDKIFSELSGFSQSTKGEVLVTIFLNSQIKNYVNPQFL